MAHALGVPAVFRFGDRLALVSLLAVNAVVLIAILGFGATGFDVLVVYWFETILIGLFAVAKLALAALIGDPFENRWVHFTRAARVIGSLVAILFFIGKFATFVAGLGLWLLVTHAMLAGSESESDALFEALTGVGSILAPCALAFLCSHALSFVVNYIGRGEFRDAGIVKLLFWPYARCIWMLVTLLVALGVAVSQSSMPQTTLFTLIVVSVKVACDLASHVVERRFFRS